MLRSHLRLACRTLRRRLGYTTINAVGLTAGLACCALVAVFLQYEVSYDAHHADADRTYRLLRDYRSSTYSTIPFEGYRRAGPAEQRSLAEHLRREVAGIEQAANFEIFQNPVYVRTADGRSFEPDRVLMTNTGPAFADLFTFDPLAGAPLGDALAPPYSAVLTRSVAERYFGADVPLARAVGQTLTLDSLDVTVRAVVADPPSNSRIRFDLALQVRKIPNWGAYHYVRLAPDTAPEDVIAGVSAAMDAVDRRRVENPAVRQNLQGDRLQAITEIQFAPRALYDDTPHRDPAYLWAFGAIGLLILGITTINYANLALALSAGRSEEVGVRKAVGGHGRQIAGQFLVEAGLLAGACVPLALGLCSAVLPAFNALMETDIAPARLLHPEVLGPMLLLGLATGLLAGAYPALVMSRRRAVDLFGPGLGRRGGGRWSLRHGLIAFQFAVLIGLGALTWIAYDQLRFMQNGDLGYATDNVVRLASFTTSDSTEYLHLRERLLASSAIEAVGTGVTPNPGNNRTNFRAAGSDVVQRDFYSELVDVGWFAAMGVEHPVVDSMRAHGLGSPERVLINRAAARRFGFEEPVGREIVLGPNYDRPTRLTVDGVLPDMHIRPMRQEIKPTVFQVVPVRGSIFGAVVRIAPGRRADALNHVRSVWAEVRPDTPLETFFLSDQVRKLYEQERRFGTLSAALAGLAIVLASIGLASLVAYLTRLRRKEIGVRKALGGSTAGIVALLNREYVRIVGAALLVGAPAAWAAAHWWLGQFAYRVEISPLVFGAAGLGALTIAVVVVSVQGLRAARVDPAHVLRSE
jgi:putative ABC transport system permease protein